MLVKMAEVLVKIAVMMMAPGGILAPPEARGREPPFFFFLLDLLPRWEKGFPSGPWLPWRGRGESPSEIGSIALFLCYVILPSHRFLYSRRSVTPIGLKFGHNFYTDIGFLAAKEGHQPPYWVATRAQGVPPTLVSHRKAVDALLLPQES